MERFGGLVPVEFDAVGDPVRPPVGMPEVQVVRADLVPQVLQARPVGIRILVAGESIGRSVDLDGVTDEHGVPTVHDVGHRSRCVAGDGMHRDGDTSSERQGLAAADQHRRFHLTGDHRLRRRDLLRLTVGVVQVLPTHRQVLVDVRLP